MTEIEELSVEDELRDELRRVRHDLEHVVHERDRLQRIVDDQLLSAAKGARRIVELERLERMATQHAFDAEADRDRERTNVANAKAEIARLRERNSTSNADTYSWYVKECDRREELESRIAKIRAICGEVSIWDSSPQLLARQILDVLDADGEKADAPRVLAYVVRDPNTGIETGYPPEAVRTVLAERSDG